MSRPSPASAPPPRWLRASRTVAPSLAVLGCLLIAAEAIQDLQAFARWEGRLVGQTELFALARRDAWLRLGAALLGGGLGLVLAFVRAGRTACSFGLAALGLLVVIHWGEVVNALPFLTAAVLVWVRDDARLHPSELAEREG